MKTAVSIPDEVFEDAERLVTLDRTLLEAPVGRISKPLLEVVLAGIDVVFDR